MDDRESEQPKELGINNLARAAEALGVADQGLMVKQAENFLKSYEDLLVQAADAVMSRDKDKAGKVFEALVEQAKERGLKQIKWDEAAEISNPGWLVKDSEGEWELHLDHSLKADPKKLLRETIHELSAWHIMKTYRLDEKQDLPWAVSKTRTDRDGRAKGYAVTHLVDATFIFMIGEQV